MSNPDLEQLDRDAIDQCTQCLNRLARQDRLLFVSSSVTAPLRLRFIDAWHNGFGSLVIAVQAPWEQCDNVPHSTPGNHL